MVVLPSTGASCYHNCCIDGGTSPENFGFHLIFLLESKLAKVAHMGSVKEKMTVAIKETIDFGWIRSSGWRPKG